MNIIDTMIKLDSESRHYEQKKIFEYLNSKYGVNGITLENEVIETIPHVLNTKIHYTEEQIKERENYFNAILEHNRKHPERCEHVTIHNRPSTSAKEVTNDLTQFIASSIVDVSNYLNTRYVDYFSFSFVSVYNKLERFSKFMDYENYKYCVVELYNMFLGQLSKIVYGDNYNKVITLNHGNAEQLKRAYFSTLKFIKKLHSKMNGHAQEYENITMEYSILLDSSHYETHKKSKQVLASVKYNGREVLLSEVLETLNNRELRAIKNHNAYENRKHALNEEYRPRYNYARRFNEYTMNDGETVSEQDTIKSNFRTPEQELLFNETMKTVNKIMVDIVSSCRNIERVRNILKNDLTDSLSNDVIYNFKRNNRLDGLTREELKYLFG